MPKFEEGEIVGWWSGEIAFFAAIHSQCDPIDFRHPRAWNILQPPWQTRIGKWHIKEPNLFKLTDMQQQDYVLAKLENRNHLNDI